MLKLHSDYYSQFSSDSRPPWNDTPNYATGERPQNTEKD